MAAGQVHIEGLAAVNRALRYVDKDTQKVIRDGFKDAAEPVRSTAESLALSEIHNLGPDWARMKIGVTTREVYVAPASRRRRGSARPNLGRLLMSRAMLPALKKHEKELAARAGQALDNLAARAGF